MPEASRLNARFLLLQALLTLVECISVAYITPLLLRYGYSAGRIGVVMMLTALAATAARPLWGFINDRYSCSRQVLSVTTCVGAGCFLLLIRTGGALVPTVLICMALYVTVVCMTNFLDSWILRLISAGAPLNYGLTRAGGSFSFAVGAAVFGVMIARRGISSTVGILLALLLPLVLAALSAPNPPSVPAQESVTLRSGLRCLAGNRVYRMMLLAFFLATLTASASDNFYSALLFSLGGDERQTGLFLFVQAMCEVPVMAGYVQLRRRCAASAAALMAFSMFFWGVKSLLMGLAPTCGTVIAAALLQALSFALFTPACMDFLLEVTPADYLSTSHLAFFSLGQGAASMLGCLVNGALADHLGIAAMFRLASAAAFAGCLLAASAARCQRRLRQRA